MNWPTVAVIITLIGCFCTLAAYLNSRDKKISNDGEWRGMINAKLDVIIGIDKRVEKVEGLVQNHGERLGKVESSASSAHKRIDEHVEKKVL